MFELQGGTFDMIRAKNYVLAWESKNQHLQFHYQFNLAGHIVNWREGPDGYKFYPHECCYFDGSCYLRIAHCLEYIEAKLLKDYEYYMENFETWKREWVKVSQEEEAYNRKVIQERIFDKYRKSFPRSPYDK